jgi:hypothetical protein
MPRQSPCSSRLLFAGTALLTAVTWRAQADYDNDDSFSLRFPAAFSRLAGAASISGYAGASAGSRWSSSINPAMLDWEKATTPSGSSISGHYNLLSFQNGTRLNVFAESATAALGDFGTISPTLAQADSNYALTRQGIDYAAALELAGLAWGKRYGDWAVGTGVNYTRSSTDPRLYNRPLLHSTSDGYGLRAGLGYGATDTLVLGVVADYSLSPSRTRTRPPFTASGHDEVTDDTARELLLRPGLSWSYWNDSALYLDYQFVSCADDSGSLQENRVFAGLDQQLWPGLYLRGGTAVDDAGAVGDSVGLGLYPNHWLAINIAYQYDMFPEIHKEFGRCQTFVGSLALNF